MSLRDLGVFTPIKAMHPLAINNEKCWKCGATIGEGTRTALLPFETEDESGSFTVEARIICGTCHLRGQEVGTPRGRRIVETVKDDDGSPFPVITTDLAQWRDEEITP